MKKLFLLLAIVGLATCAGESVEAVKFDNQSSYTISFVILFDSIKKTLEPGQTTVVNIAGGFQELKDLTIKDLTTTSTAKVVVYKEERNTVTFRDVEPIEAVKLDNQSSYAVTASYVILSIQDSKTLEPGKTAVVNITGGTKGFKSLTTTPNGRVEYKAEGNTITFSDIAPINLEVWNALVCDAILTAGIYMDRMTVTTGAVNKSNKIYTKTPTFAATSTVSSSAFPLTVTYTYNAGRNTMYVTIH
jgi:hypothetical protein